MPEMAHSAIHLWACRAAALLAVGPLLWAQAGAPCEGPKQVEARRAGTTASQFGNMSGVWFAQRGNFECAIAAFENVLRSDPNSEEARYNLGLALLENHQVARARKEFEALVQRLPTKAALRLGLGMAIEESGDLAAAESEYREALKLGPGSAQALLRLGTVLKRQKRYTAAIAYLQKAVAIEPANPANSVELADAMYENGSAGGIGVLEKAVSASPRSAAAQASLGILLGRDKRYEEAASHFRAALELDPSDDVTRLSLAKALLGLDRQAEAVPVLAEVLTHQPRNPEAHYLRGFAYRGVGEYDRAAPDLEFAVKANPREYAARYNYGFVLAKLNRPEEARIQLEAARELQPDSQEAQFQLANVLRRLDQKEAAQQQLAQFEQRKKLDQMENIAGTTASRANQALVDGDPKTAVDGYLEALKLDPSNAKTYFNLALAQQKLGDANAVSSLEKAVELDPAFAAARNQLGLLYLVAHRDDDAEKQFQAALAADPQCAECQNNLGVLAGSHGDSRRAEDLFRQAIENSPSYTQARVNVALILAARENFAEARRELETALASDPDNLKALTALGMVQSRTRDAAAIQTLSRVVSLDPNSADAHLNLGIALADRQQSDEALAEFSKAAQIAPQQASTHYNKGRILGDLRRYDEALPELRLASQLDPSVPDAWFRLGIAERESQHYGPAADAFRASLKLNPKQAGASYLLGQSLQSAGESKAAIAAWKDALATDPNHAQALYSLSRALAKIDPGEATHYRTRFTALQAKNGADEQARTLSNFAIAAAQAGNWNVAVAQFNQAIQVCGSCPSSAILHKNLGLTECRAGRFQDCEAELRSVLDELHGDAEILKAIQMLEEIRNRPHHLP
jgi:tetratricopeptide (TPR) repeat protein